MALKKKRSRRSRRTIKRRLAGIIIGFLAIAVIIFWMTRLDKKPAETKDQQHQAKLEEIEILDDDIALVALEKLRERIANAQDVLDESDSETIKHQAVVSILSDLTKREEIEIDNDTLDSNHTAELLTVAESYDNSENPEVFAASQVGVFAARVSFAIQHQSRTGVNSDIVQDAEVDKIVPLIQKMSTDRPEDLSIAQQTLEWIQIASDHLPDEFANSLCGSFLEIFSNSPSYEALAREARQLKIEKQSLEIEDFLAETASNRNESVQKFLTQFNDLTDDRLANVDLYSTLVSRAIDLMALGKSSEAKSVFEKLQSIDLAGKDPTVEHSFNRLAASVKLFGQRVDNNVFMTLDKAPVNFEVDAAKVRCLVFFDTADRTKTMSMFGEVRARMRGFIRNDQAELLGILMDTGKSKKDIKDIKTVVEKNKTRNVWLIDIDSDAAAEFYDQIRLIPPPFLLFLNERNEIISIGATPAIAEELTIRKVQ